MSDDLDGGQRFLLQAAEDVQAATAAVAAQAVGRIGDVAELVEDEAGDDQRPHDEAGLGDVGYPSVDDGAGIQRDVTGETGSPLS